VKITTGPWVDGDEFFGRERELNQLGEILQNKRASAFIPGPRRIGKTSLVMECIRRNRNKYKFMYLDLESRHSLPELCEDLIQEIQKSHPRLIKSRPNLKNLWNTLSEMFPKIKIPGVIDLETGKISEEGKKDSQFLKKAPYSTVVRRIDEVRAARNPVLIYKKK